MNIRELAPGEAPTLWTLFYDTVHIVNARDYDLNQRRAWAPSDLDPAVWARKIRALAPFVADWEGEIVGYSDLQPDGLIDHFFVHHQWQRRGVGRTLMAEIERRAEDFGLARLTTHASITAKPFFEAFGFVEVALAQVQRRGATLTNYHMCRDR